MRSFPGIRGACSDSPAAVSISSVTLVSNCVDVSIVLRAMRNCNDSADATQGEDLSTRAESAERAARNSVRNTCSGIAFGKSVATGNPPLKRLNLTFVNSRILILTGTRSRRQDGKKPSQIVVSHDFIGIPAPRTIIRDFREEKP